MKTLKFLILLLMVSAASISCTTAGNGNQSYGCRGDHHGRGRNNSRCGGHNRNECACTENDGYCCGYKLNNN